MTRCSYINQVTNKQCRRKVRSLFESYCSIHSPASVDVESTAPTEARDPALEVGSIFDDLPRVDYTTSMPEYPGMGSLTSLLLTGFEHLGHLDQEDPSDHSDLTDITLDLYTSIVPPSLIIPPIPTYKFVEVPIELPETVIFTRCNSGVCQNYLVSRFSLIAIHNPLFGKIYCRLTPIFINNYGKQYLPYDLPADVVFKQEVYHLMDNYTYIDESFDLEFLESVDNAVYVYIRMSGADALYKDTVIEANVKGFILDAKVEELPFQDLIM